MGEITWGTATATLAAPFVFFLPGWALLSLLMPPESFESKHRPDLGTWLALATGLTLAVTPVALLALYLVGVKIGAGVVFVYLAASLAIIVWQRGPIWRAWWQQPMSWRDRLAWLDAPLLALALVMVLILGVRLWVVRGLNIGFWGDSYHHTMISQLILDNGGLFQSWEPYASLQSLSYHFGLHSNVALFQWATGWLTGNPTPRTVVLVGQFLNALAALTLYPLTVRLSEGSRWAGVVSVLIAGLLTPMPMFYINWGRYTQLAGQVVLPAAIWLTMDAAEARNRDLGRLALAVLAAAGLALIHYRVVVMYAAFLVPYLAYHLWIAAKRDRLWFEPIARVALIGAASLVLALPWLWALKGGSYPAIAAGFFQGKAASSWVAEYNAIGRLWDYVSPLLVVLAGLGMVWGLWRRQVIALVGFWVVVVILLTNPHLLGLPGTGLMTNFAIVIAVYVPVSLLVGYLVAEGLERPTKSWPIVRYAALITILLISIWGAQERTGDLHTEYQLVTPADEQAMSWIRQNTPPDARFLVNGFFAYGGGVVVGSDAGWWIPLLTGRENTMPPINYATETPGVPDYRSQVEGMVQKLQNAALDDPATVQSLKQSGISYVYIGEKGGPLLKLEELQRSDLYQQVYHQGQVWIFKIKSGQEQASHDQHHSAHVQ